MYYRNELDVMPGIYKCYGDINYLRFRIRLEIMKSSMIPLSNIEEQETGLDPQYNEREEIEFSWNEKIFSPTEIKFYSDPQNCRTSVEKEYQNYVTKLTDNEKNSPSNRLFTYTTKDVVPKKLYKNILYKEEYRGSFFGNDNAPYYSSGHSSREKNLDCVCLPVKNIVDYYPSNELKRLNRSLYSGYDAMYIAADLSDRTLSSESSSNECEHLLVTIKWNKSTSTLTIMPDFASFNTPGYKIDVDALTDTRYVYRYWILNVSQTEEAKNLGKIEKLTNELSSYQSRLSCTWDFEVPYKNSLNVFIFAEIQKAIGFLSDNLFVQYYIHLPEAWSSENSSLLSGITQQCAFGHKDEVAQFSYLFEIKLSVTVTELGNNVEELSSHFKMPQLIFEICSLDSWKRFRVEGYAWTILPTLPGRHKLILSSWRPAPQTNRDELRRFFIGCDREISDFTYTGIPANLDNKLLSRYGFESISSGDLHIELNILHQIGKAIPPKKASHMMDKARTVVLMNSVNHILEAFKKARERMLIAREPFTF